MASSAGTLLSLRESAKGRSKVRAKQSPGTCTLTKMHSGKPFRKDHHKAGIFLVEITLEVNGDGVPLIYHESKDVPSTT